MNDKEPAEKMLEYCKQLEDENIITTYFNQEKEREKEQNKMNIINEFNKITYINYDISNHYSFDIDFLFDYCKILGSEKNDSKLIQWQVMNKDRLFIYGLNMAELMERINKSQPKGANSKLDTIISNLNYRLQRHGRLAPTKDIARKLDKKFDDQLPLEEEEADNDIDIEIEEDIAEDKNNNMNNIEEGNENNIANNNNVNNKNLVQENYYDINDPFIDDNLDEISEGEDNKLLFKLKLKPGNYTESEIMNNLRKHLRPKKNFKRIKTKIHTSQTDNEATNDNEENTNNIPYKTNSDNYVDITEYKLKRAMNSLLPPDIHVISTEKVDNNFHARYGEKEKEYKYFLNMGEYDPTKRNTCYQYNRSLDVKSMQEAIKYFIGEHDFESFTPTVDKRENNVRTITKATLEEKDNILEFTFRGNGFIKYQVRNMVGYLIKVGEGKKKGSDIPKILLGKDRRLASITAHSEGLYLTDVKY